MKFKVGDRVRNWRDNITGTIVAINKMPEFKENPYKILWQNDPYPRGLWTETYITLLKDPNDILKEIL